MYKRPTPIKRHTGLIEFSRDHHYGLLLGWKIRKGFKLGVTPDRITDYVLYFFDNDLGHHFKCEEELLFPKLAPNDPLRIQAETEHREIYRMIEVFRNDKTNAALLDTFAGYIEKHIRFEERQLFQKLQELLSDEELKFIASSFKPKRLERAGCWNDNFWGKRFAGT